MQVRPELNEIGYGKWEGQTREKVGGEYHALREWLADPGGMRQPTASWRSP